ncbi:MSC_0882 family membrane protein [Metamycoplasma neophronis]|uniref:RDD family protein n=1 Tax=Metamycoplasma neophronis TaxID=872983 RepID=A0ABY2Z0J0_9BACT|nr:hypothetical protein [Metamycoplasma neophronis]TPR53903.1 hypothetical protein FJR74_01945 [Metamycoplasma neophronis]
MGIKPILTGEDTKQLNIPTATFSSHVYEQTMETKTFGAKNKIFDPKGIIPNGIYSVFRQEINIKKIMLSIDAIIFFIALITSLIFGFAPGLFNKTENYHTPWGWYIVPVFLMVLTLSNFIFESIELTGIKRNIAVYRESIKAGSSSTPPFISLLYRKLMLKQVYRTWIVVAIIFYVGLFTLAFWGLQDKKWGKLDFNKWIHNSFPNPNIVVYVLCGIMGLVLILFIINTIFRKKRMVDIQSFFGNEVMNYSELAEKRSKAHHKCAKIFFLSILVILVLPFILYIILKKTVLKGK